MASDRQLAQVLSEFARTMLTDFPIQGILDHLVERIVEIMPVTGAGVTLISPGVGPRYIAASNADALGFEELQSELGDGPCVLAYRSGQAIVVPDLRTERRFPEFVARALNIGLEAVFTFPLRHEDHQLGALDLYRGSPGELSVDSLVAAQTLADVTTAYLVNAQARADLVAASHRLREFALHDPLTGLPNRVLLVQRIEHALLRSRRSGLSSAVLFLDLDRFKSVNDTYGHVVGDRVLVGVARRLIEAVRGGDTVARLSGDEFVVLCEDLRSRAEAEVILGRLEGALGRPVEVAGLEIELRASIGVAFTDQSMAGADEIIHAADQAMYRAKRAGSGRWVLESGVRGPAS
ncbi:MAG TPA: sensor domain-containing diguanylate cyclase [Acidimicrobiales bacterium]|nr:sensor domain-containing diguanylate cyclase [Acidimicrobiales bacterium]